MRQATQGRDLELSRRAFLAATSGVLAGAAAFGLVSQAETGQRHPKRGGTLRFATRSDVSGLDLHRNTIYLVSMPLAAINQGLLDLDQQSEPVPGVAAAWEAPCCDTSSQSHVQKECLASALRRALGIISGLRAPSTGDMDLSSVRRSAIPFRTRIAPSCLSNCKIGTDCFGFPFLNLG